ncbi:B3/B4 domain-containing protein [Ihubacter sp. rT4E-8]|uniref:B3/B4 domain-containing protein n=1 Tax=unclassified Ihubacter TaxID=2633299 RepID=UPI00137B389C
MKRLICKEDFWELFPDCKIGIVVCKGMENIYRDDETEYEKMIRDSEKEALTFLTEPNFADNRVIRVWREAYMKFKTKKGARCAIEALMKRISKENHLGTINPIVDIYNSVSLSHAMPCGGEDLDTVEGDILLTKAAGDESFFVIGSDENEPPFPGELVYKDDAGVLCRCWTWRESKRTMLTENTKNAMLCCELVDAQRYDTFVDVLACLKREVEARLGAQCEIRILDREHPEVDLL